MAVELESAWSAHPDHRIDLVPVGATGQVWSGDLLVAESDRCLVVKETGQVDHLYFPDTAVQWDLFTRNDRHTLCAFKGRADCWDLRTGEPRQRDVAWGYRTPSEQVAGLAGYVGFDHDRLRVEVSDRWPDGSMVVSRFPIWGDAAELVRLIDVIPDEPGRFVGPAYGQTPRNVVEGGQLLGEAIVAASKTVPNQRVTSASMIFSKAASFDAPVDVGVEVLRGGRTFSTVEVRVSQEGSLRSAALVLMDATVPDVIHHSAAMPDVPGPQDAVPYDFRTTGRDIRVVDGAYDPDPDRIGPAELFIWVRFKNAPREPYLHAALLAQSTTHWTIGAAMRPHPGFGEADAHRTLSTGVMKTTIAFHDDVDVTEWLLYENPAIYAGRGLAQGDGRVFTRDGRLVASYSAQVMIRPFVGASATQTQDFRTAM